MGPSLDRHFHRRNALRVFGKPFMDPSLRMRNSRVLHCRALANIPFWSRYRDLHSSVDFGCLCSLCFILADLQPNEGPYEPLLRQESRCNTSQCHVGPNGRSSIPKLSSRLGWVLHIRPNKMTAGFLLIKYFFSRKLKFSVCHCEQK